MYKATLTRIFIIAILVTCAFAALPQTASAKTFSDISPIRLQFDKQGGVGGTWHGTVNGDVDGSLTTQLLTVHEAGPILNVTFTWAVEAGEHSFTAVLKGTLNTLTGQVEMDGTIIDGWLVGAQVHEEGQLVDPTIGRFQGKIVIFPATAN